MFFPYDLENPRQRYPLSRKYRELSGVCSLPGSGALAFVQDEAIRVYRFDLQSADISAYVKYESGDAEDIVVVENTAYVLRAGKRPAIFRIADYQQASAQCERYDLDLDRAYDPEGLCYDLQRQQLLIACKGSPVKNGTQRKVFSFDLHSGRRSKQAAFVIDCKDFLVPSKETFNPSGIAIHPISGDIYCIGTKGAKMIVCYSRNGHFKAALTLNNKLFFQPEGIAFLDNGDLVIATEGQQGKKGSKAEICIFAAQE